MMLLRINLREAGDHQESLLDREYLSKEGSGARVDSQNGFKIYAEIK